MSKRLSTALCVGAALALALSGCGKDNESGGDGDSAGGDIKVMVIESMTGVTGVDQTSPKGAEAAAKAINASGGVDGQDITVLSCDTASDPNKATECARKAVSEKVTAVVGSFDPIGVGASLPILEAAKIPYVAQVGTMPVEFSATNSFPVTGGAGAGSFGTVAAAKNAGCTSVALWGDTAADSGQTEGLKGALDSQGMTTTLVDLPTGTTDVTPMVAQAIEGDPDCAIYIAAGQTAVQIIGALAKAGSDAQFITAQAVLLPPFLEALGSGADGIIATTDSPDLGSPELKPFLDDIQAYDADLQFNQFTLAGWYGVKLVAEAAKGLDSVSNTTVLDALSKMSDVELPGLPPLDFTATTDSKVYPRMFNAAVQYTEVKGGMYAATDGEWHDITDVLP